MVRALVFPGQGAQYVGMAMTLADSYPVAAQLLKEAEQTLKIPLTTIMKTGPEAELVRTDISQPAILVASAMALAVARQCDPTLGFSATAGLSLGEYTALFAAEALDYVDALRLVRLRGQLMQVAAEMVPSAMVALIGADEATAAKLCAAAAGGEVLQVANLNAPGQVVISGAKGACERAMAQAKELGIRRAVALPVAGAFHSTLMAPAANKLREALAKVALRDAKIPVYSNVTAAPVTAAAQIRELLVEQLTKPVRWADSVVAMNKAGITEFLELGPGKTLSGMITRTVTGITVRNLDTATDAMAFAGAANRGAL
jgi:[acyl-carrier-protein] S-malonyltransferase